MSTRYTYISLVLLVLVAGSAFVAFNHRAHLFDWDEINFAESAREMIVTGDYQTVQINYKPFWEKPPLFIWFQALSMKVFGINEFAARFPNAVCGVFTLLFVFFAGTRLFDNRFGLLWLTGYLGSVLPFFYFKSGIIDPWFNLFIFSSIYFLFQFSRPETKSRTLYLCLSAALIGLAVLTKGPVGLLVFLITAGTYLIINKFRFPINVKQIGLFTLIFALTGGSWFIVQIVTGNFDTVKDFFVYQVRLFQTQDAGHGGFPFYHVVVFLVGVFPLSVFALRGMTWRYNDSESQKHFRRWMMILFWVVLILFSVVKTKIVHYSSLFYFPVSFLGAYAVYRTLNNTASYKKWIPWLVAIIGYTFSLVALALPNLASNMELVLQTIPLNDPFTLANLQAGVSWGPIDYIPGALMAVVITLYLVIGRWNYIRAYYTLCLGTAAFVFVAMLLFIGKIEGYSQRAAIDFYKTLNGKDVHIETAGFKSYAHLFYAGKPLPSAYDLKITDWLTQPVTKPVYVVLKISTWNEMGNQHPALEELFSRNGFVFCKKKNKK